MLAKRCGAGDAGSYRLGAVSKTNSKSEDALIIPCIWP
jgi:hypothetical protein